MEFDRVDDTKGQPPQEWPAHFEGRAKVQPLPSPFPNGLAMFAVHFVAGGRSKPHVHHAGQILHVISGRGVVGGVDGRREVGPGDVVVAMAGEWHWHGAAPDSPMTHVNLQLPGDTIDWDVEERDWADGYH